MSDTLVGTYDNLAAAIESANASEKFDNLKTWYESVKEMYEKGDVGTDDFQTMAQFGVGYNIKKRLAGGGYEYRADAYVEAYQQAEVLLLQSDRTMQLIRLLLGNQVMNQLLLYLMVR